MHRNIRFVAFGALLALSIPLAALAQERTTAPSAAQTPRDNTLTAKIPVRAVTLFSSGVSFTLREGEVSGDATIPLSFRTTQINDILKSLVLLDEKGKVQPAVYGARDPIGRTLQSFAVDVNRPPSRADLLSQLRGQRATVEAGGQPLPGTNPPVTTPVRTYSGQIVGVEATPIPTLLLLTDAGLQSVRLDDVTAVKLLDPTVNRELAEALSLLASGADDKRRQVVLRFDGTGTRRVRVGYVTESPLWKVSYRLLLGGSGISGQKTRTAGAKPYIQGWALVENVTDEDWVDVRLSLVSGRPISFIQDLYQPLYLPRPIVPLDVVASPYPQLAEGALERRDQDVAAKPDEASMMFRRGLAAPGANGPAGGRGFGGGLGGGGFGGVNGLAADAPAATPMDISNAAIARSSVMAQAQGEKSGELFAYHITQPVSLPRQQAAMIPVIAQEIDGEKVSLYNADSDPRHPMNGVRIRNGSGLHLKAGPVTLFDDGVYAGDARMDDIPPGDSRILTYAVDLAVDGERQDKGGSAIETGISIRRGVLIIARKETVETQYTIKNKSDEARTVLVEHPFDSAYKLIAPAKFDERTPGLYRFAVNVAPGKNETLTVRLERPLAEEAALLDTDITRIEYQVQRKSGVTQKVLDALRNVLAQRRKIQELESQAASRQAEIKSIEEDQDRVRRNMAALDRNSALYQRYVKQLDEQETRIQALRAEVTALGKQAANALGALRAFLDTLDVTG